MSPDQVKEQANVPQTHLAVGYVVGTAIVMIFFVRFVLPACQFQFAPDDPMAIYYYWSRGPWSVVKALLLFFSTYYRPMGGVFYGTIYHFFGLNPLPYHVAISCLILLNAYLAYRFARLVSESNLIAGITATIAIYHSELSALVYLPSYIYDILCFTFFFLALNYYIAIRRTGALLTRKQTVVFLLLYISALDSKEMAVSLPMIALFYEAIRNPPAWRAGSSFMSWLRREALLPLIAGVITSVYIIGKTHGSNALITNPQYQPTISYHRFVESNLRFLDTFFYLSFTKHTFTLIRMLLLWTAVFLLAFRLRSKHLLLAMCFLIITPLPITFIPLRPGAALYIPLVGWAMTISTIWLSLAIPCKRLPCLRRLSSSSVQIALTLLLLGYLWKSNVHDDRRFLPPLKSMGSLTQSVIEQLKTLQPTVQPGTQIVFLKDPFNGWNMKFIAELLYRDHSVKATLIRYTPHPREQISKANIVFDWLDGRLVRVKGSSGAVHSGAAGRIHVTAGKQPLQIFAK